MKYLSWEESTLWEAKVNAGKADNELKWKWDCNFKLDFDGGLVSVESRFYPPSYHKEGLWTGTLRVKVLRDYVLQKEFEGKTLEHLHEQVESFIKHYKEVVKSKFS